MSLEELWELFPIVLVGHNDSWKEWFAAEREFLERILPKGVRIHHIGSTAIEGIWTKPIVDILVEAARESFGLFKLSLVQNGYICMAESENSIDFNKGYTPDGFAGKVFHLHLKRYGDNDEIYFRDYLNARPEIAKEYEKWWTIPTSTWATIR